MDPITTTEMHTGGEPVRIVEDGYPEIPGGTILEKRAYVRAELDDLRKLLMFEPRGHYDMYGVIPVEPSLPGADLAVLFMHNEGYSTMCGHATIALGRWAVDRGFVEAREPETTVNLECPCGLVVVHTEIDDDGNTGAVRYESVPSFVFATDVEVDVAGAGLVEVDIGYGGAFYAYVPAPRFGLDVLESPIRDLVDAAAAVTEATSDQVLLDHPEDPELSFLYGTILTDGNDEFSDEPTANVCVFAERQVDRSPTGSGVTARIALQLAKGEIEMGQIRRFQSITHSEFTGRALRRTEVGPHEAVIVEVGGRSHYTGKATFTLEDGDPLPDFLLN